MFTPVPNDFFEHVSTLTDAELRILLLVIRQTYGWKDSKTGGRKLRDRMTYAFIIKRTGLYRTCLSAAIQSLITKQLIIVTDFTGTILDTAQKRKGRHALFYQYRPVRISGITCSQSRTPPVRKPEHNKRNTYQKKLIQKRESFAELGNKTLAEIRSRMDRYNRKDV